MLTEPAPRVLIVDDNPTLRRLLERVLANQGFDAVSAGDGEEALAVADRQPPDAVLLDIAMPVLDGLEVCRRLRRNPRTATVPILMVTAVGDQEKRVAGYEAGADDFVSKPFDVPELTARLRSRLRLASTRRQDAQAQGVMATLRLVSHEFSNPLQSVVGGLDLLGMARRGEAVDEGEAIAMVSEGTERLTDVALRMVGITRPSYRETPIGPMLDIDESH